MSVNPSYPSQASQCLTGFAITQRNHAVVECKRTRLFQHQHHNHHDHQQLRFIVFGVVMIITSSMDTMSYILPLIPMLFIVLLITSIRITSIMIPISFTIIVTSFDIAGAAS